MHVRFAFRKFVPVASVCGALLNPVVQVSGAQSTPRVESRIYSSPGTVIAKIPDVFSNFVLDDKRAVIGVTLRAGGKGDTLGLYVDDVARNGPAEKAGLRQGQRITAVNGVNLRVPATDVDDDALLDVNQRRLQREIAKAKAGDDVELRVTENGSSRTVKVKTVAASELNNDAPRMMRMSGSMVERRASIGVSVGNTGSIRDTLGLFISSVVTNGPAEKAGVVEGDRIAAINGSDVRVPREDTDDSQASSARMNRFLRELAKASPGDKITLKIFSSGRYRDVQITAGANNEQGPAGVMLRNFGDTPMQMRSLTVPPRTMLRRVFSVL